MKRYGPTTALGEVGLIVLACVFISPFFLLVNTALRAPGEGGSALDLTTQPTLENAQTALSQGDLGIALINSAVVTVFATLLSVILASLASYPLARSLSRLSKGVFVLFLVGLLLPIQLAILPLYTLMRDTGLLGSLAGLIIYYSGTTMPFSVFLYTTFLRSVPLDYEEAARIDGCGPVRAFIHVTFPLLRPVTGTVVILNGINIYNDFFTPLLFLAGSGQQTAPVAVQAFVGEFSANWPVVFSGLLIALIPVLVLYFALQKHIIRGFSGGIKG
jgi:raffinose/stachyose/melibiose transport system permease protein